MADQIVWLDRESVAYVRDGRSVAVWVDFAPGFFSRGREIHADSIKEWAATESMPATPVSANERREIIAALTSYYRRQWRSVAVVT